MAILPIVCTKSPDVDLTFIALEHNSVVKIPYLNVDLFERDLLDELHHNFQQNILQIYLSFLSV